MNRINWYDSKKKQPKDKQRILYYRPEKLTKVGEMVYHENNKQNFILYTPYWSEKLNKPNA